MHYPALDVRGADLDLLLALVDDFAPSAVDEQGELTRIFFSNQDQRSRAGAAITARFPAARVEPRDVDDEDWARRSQENLLPVTIGGITVAPPWAVDTSGFGLRASGFGLQASDFERATSPESQAPSPEPRVPSPVLIVISPSMGFGTGHHATTRLCLAALQTLKLRDRIVMDVGTGSGVLAIAARLLGAREAIGLDNDADAIQAAAENLALNPEATNVHFHVRDLRAEALEPADVVTANLTGALLIQSVALLRAALRHGGRLILSGLQTHERDAVVSTFSEMSLVWEREEQGWVALMFTARTTPSS